MLADRVRRRRVESGLTATEVARQAGVSKAYLSAIESGRKTRPSAAVLARLAEALGTTVPDLLERDLPPDERTVPESLRAFAAQEGLPPEDVAMLAHIRYRGRQPATPKDWAFVYEAVRRSVAPPPD